METVDLKTDHKLRFCRYAEMNSRFGNLASQKPKLEFILVCLFPVLLSLLLLCSCFSRPALMSYEEYDQVEMGISIATIQSEIGKPYAIHNKKDGGQEYEYIERIDTGNNIVAENHYFLIVQDGKVTGKYMKREKPPAYDLIYQDQPNYPAYPGTALPP